MKSCTIIFILAYHVAFIECSYFRKDYKYEATLTGWVKLHRIPEKWENARLRCLLEGSTLATPLNPDSMTIMKTMMGKSVKIIFTGVSAIYSDGDFFSVEGYPLEEMPYIWAPDEPNNSGDERCIAMYADGTLADVNCNKPLPYVCFRKDPNITSVNKCGTTDPDYVFEARTGHCYKFHRIGQIWPEVFTTCSVEGGHLAVVNSDVEDQVLKDLIAKYPYDEIEAMHKGVIGVGFRDWKQDRVFMTIHGQSLKDAGFERWSLGNPSNSGPGEYCGSLLRDGLLNDVYCDQTVPFICEKLPVSLLDDVATNNQITVPSVSQCGTIDSGYVFEARTGHCYKFHRFGQSWSKAFMTCSAEGGHLAIINSDEEAEVLKNLITKYPADTIFAKHKAAIGLGFRDWSQHGVFMTIHGQTLQEAGYDKFSTGQPDNSTTGEYCGTMFANGYLNDIWCEDTTPFICEMTPKSLQDTGSKGEVNDPLTQNRL